jgi:hypothetical protein
VAQGVGDGRLRAPAFFRKHVAAAGIIKTYVYVKTAAGEFLERLGHERRADAVPARLPLDDPFQQQGMVAGGHRIVHVVQVDLHLARRELRMRGSGRHVLDSACLAHRRQEIIAFPQVLHHGVLQTVLLHSGTGDAAQQRPGDGIS